MAPIPISVLKQRLLRNCTLSLSSKSTPEKKLVLGDGLDHEDVLRRRWSGHKPTGSKYHQSDCPIKTEILIVDYDNFDSFVEINFDLATQKQNPSASSTSTVRFNREAIKTGENEPALVDCRVITIDDADQITGLFGFDKEALQSYITAAGMYPRRQQLFLISWCFTPHPPSRNLTTRGSLDGSMLEDFTCVQEVFKSGGTAHALLSTWEDSVEKVNFFNARISKHRAHDPLGDFYNTLGLMKPKPARPQIIIDQQSSFSTWNHYQVLHEYALMEEQDIADGRTGARLGTLRLISIPQTANSQFFGVLERGEAAHKLNEGDTLRVCVNSTKESDFKQDASWKATVISHIPFAPSNSTSVIVYREFLEEEGVYDTQEVQHIEMNTITSIPDSKIALQNATPVPVVYIVETNTAALSRNIRSLRQLGQLEDSGRFGWAHAALLGHNIMAEPTIDLFKGIEHDRLSGRAMTLAKSRLNPEQKSALEMTRSLPSGIGIVQGPPGTGKTFFISNLVQPIVWSSKPRRGPSMLVLSTSNQSVDDLTERIQSKCKEFAQELSIKRTIVVLRVHSAETESLIVRRQADLATSSHLASFSPNHPGQSSATNSLAHAYKRAQSKPFGVEDKRLRLIDNSLGVFMLKVARMPDSKLTKKEKPIVASFRTLYSKFKAGELSEEDMERFKKAEYALRDVALSRADVVLTTLSNSGTSGISRNVKPRAIVVDEAARASDPEILSIFAWYDKEVARIIVGDSRQLQPVADHANPMRHQLALSALQRLQSLGYPFVQLCEQRRSPSAIMDVFSHAWYEKTLKASKEFEATFKEKLNVFKTFLQEKYAVTAPKSASLFHLARGTASQDASGSWYNKNSARVSLQAVIDLMSFGVEASRIAILTPYSAQTSLYLASRTHLSQQHAISSVNIETFDSIQGREFDYTIVDFVRTDGLGFLSEGNRVNVALSRARFGMIVVMQYSQLYTTRPWKSSGLEAAMLVLRQNKGGNRRVTEEDIEKMVSLESV